MSDGPSLLDHLPEAAVWRLEDACTRFEADWLAGRRPRPEDYLEGLSGPGRLAALRELILLDIYYRRRAGDAPAVGDYAARFPEARQILAESPHPEPVTVSLPPLKANETTALTAPAAEPPAAGVSAAVRFERLRFHAAGNLGEVYVAADAELGREVALKEMQPRHAHCPDRRARFRLEGEVTGRLEHPGVVPVYGLGTYPDGRPYYAMRFVRGETLGAAIGRFHQLGPGRFDRIEFRQLLARFVAVCQTVAYAHDRGVLHRDLKPENIMLGRFGETLVVDWGLARVFGPGGDGGPPADRPFGPVAADSATATGSVLGTPAFMSPEQAAGRVGELGPASDVYGLGATLYALLTNRPPFRGSMEEVLEAVRSGRWEPARRHEPGVPPAVEAVCGRAMATNPAARYPSAAALADDVERWLADEPVAAFRDPPVARARRWVRKHPKMVSAGAVVLLAAVAGLAAGAAVLDWRKREAEENFRVTREATHTLLAAVNEEHLLHEPGMRPLREKLLSEALDYYFKFLERRPGDRPVRAEKASTHRQLAELWGEMGQLARARPQARQAVEQYRELVREDPGGRDVRAGLAQALMAAAELDARSGEPAAAEAAATEAIGELGRLRADTPDDSNVLTLLGRAYAARTTARAGRGDLEPAIDDNAQAGALLFQALFILLQEYTGRNEAVARHPDMNEQRGEFGTSYLLFQAWLSQGRLQLAAGRKAEAVRSLATAAAFARWLQHQYAYLQRYNPRAGRLRIGLAAAQLGLGRAYLDLGRPAAAGPALAEAADLARGALEDLPEEAGGECRAILARAVAYVGEAEYRLGHTARAAALLEDAEARTRGSGPELSTDHARVLAVRARLAADRGEPARGLADCDRALAEQQRALAAAEWDRCLRADWLATRRLAVRLRPAADRVRALREVLAEEAALARTEPVLPYFRRGSVETAGELARALLDAGDPAAAAAAIDAALPDAERLVAEDAVGFRLAHPPTRRDPGADFRASPRRPVVRLERSGIPEDFTAPDPLREPEDAALRRAFTDLLAVRASLGRPTAAADAARAAAAADRLAAGPADLFVPQLGGRPVWLAVAALVGRREPGYLYDAACHWTLVASQGGTPDAADRAARALAELVACGFDNATALRTDPRLSAVRSRPDVRELVAAVEARNPPAPPGRGGP